MNFPRRRRRRRRGFAGRNDGRGHCVFSIFPLMIIARVILFSVDGWPRHLGLANHLDY